MTFNNGTRLSTNGAFIRPIRRECKNLTIKTEAYVTRLLVDSKTKRVLGFEYASTTKINETKLNVVLARKKVILSAGAIKSPKILMLSGIGPRKESKKHGINVINDLSVERNLQDHVSMRGLTIALNFTSTRKNNSIKEENIFYYEKTYSLYLQLVLLLVPFSCKQPSNTKIACLIYKL